MDNFVEIVDNFSKDTLEAVEWMSNQYENNFGKWFSSIRRFHTSISNVKRPITDEELSDILMNVPLDMIECSESLNSVKLQRSLLKLSIKKKKSSNEEYDPFEDEVILSILDCLISRVDKEMSFARELIMSAKKIWDGRRLTEGLNPTDATTSVDDLPDYDEAIGKQKNRYIK